MRLIDADAIAPKLEGKFNQDMVRYAPTIDAVPVVRWIPVTERLPEDGQTVIACVTHRFGDESIIPMVFWHESYFHWQDVTHWMPLPEPPMRKGENDG